MSHEARSVEVPGSDILTSNLTPGTSCVPAPYRDGTRKTGLPYNWKFPAPAIMTYAHALYGKEDVKDEPRSGRPPTSTTPDNIERVQRMLADDRRLSLRMIAEEFKISPDSVRNIIHEHLQKRKKKVYAFPTLLRSSNV
ncbi:hypothetical protein AVEN_5125-1 [Araneus ventricosus]|uniref:Paired domain-containing protein n=1 Tax=Araneus ventricosus TaxID=182803 RepID=A0A4Y2K1M2_ARAVE|nr:hypothetical protein AVEN_5125-1 [Araneus ventricosus]